MKGSTRLGLFSLFALLYTSAVSAEKLHYLVIGQSVPPLQFETNGVAEKRGIVTEIVYKIFEGSEHQINPVVMPWSRHVKQIKKNKRTLWITYGIPSWMPTGAQFSTESIFDWRHALITPQSSTIKFRDIQDLYNKEILLIHGYDYPGLEPYLASLHSDGPIVDYRPKSPKQAISMLTHGKAHGYVEVDWRAIYYIKQAGLPLSDYVFNDFSSVIQSTQMKLMFDEDMPPGITQLINQRLTRLKQDGRIDAILANYR